MIGLVLATFGFAHAANAASRFEANNKAPHVTSVRVDFTIVVPEILTLRIDRDEAPQNALKGSWSRVVAQPSGFADAQWADGAPMPFARASSNAGTLAVGTYDPATDPDLAEVSASPPGRYSAVPAITGVHMPGASSARDVSLGTHPAIFLIALP